MIGGSLFLEGQENILNEKEENKKYLDKICGCLIGGAAGDALGYPVEFLLWEDIQKHFGIDGITEYQLHNQTRKALISDDTQMTLFTANGILYGYTRGYLRGIMAPIEDYIYQAYLDWLSTQTRTSREYSEDFDEPEGISWILDIPELYSRRAPGNSCLSALKSGNKGSIEEPVNNSKGCGGIMRIAPVALCSHMQQKPIQTIDLIGAKAAAVTHGHSLGYMSAAVLVHIIYSAVYQNENNILDLYDIVKDSRHAVIQLFAGDKNLAALTSIMDKAVFFSQNGKNDKENIRNLGEGWVAEETLAIALYCSLKYKNDFSKGITAAVNHSGDSDSTGAVTGNILGAYLGYDKIEEKWKSKLELKETILELAKDLCYGCQMSEYENYNDEAWKQKYIHLRKT